MVLVSTYNSPFGGITLAGEGEYLTGLWFDGQRYWGSTLPDKAQYSAGDLPVFAAARRWLESYFSGAAPSFTPPLKFIGTSFQKAVWESLLTIPYGSTTTYSEVARITAQSTGAPCSSARAVGGAVGRNPLALIVPCHRVIGANGSLTGYAGGVDTKSRLLALERACCGGGVHQR